MALVAKMSASEVNQRGGGRWVACAEDAPGAMPIEGNGAISSMYGIPPWLQGTGFVRHDPNGQSLESIVLTAVSAKDEDDPNREWAMASPSGQLSMTIQNPDAFGYVVPGAQYRVTIERIRGPRGKDD